MSRTIYHRDGSKTVRFSDGRKATFGAPHKSKSITGTPYVFAAGRKIRLPSGVAHGMIFEERGRLYVALRYKGTDAQGRGVQADYGQPITLTRPL